MARERTQTSFTRRLEGGSLTREPDELIVEEPLEIRLDDHLVATTMRTPGHDFELATGFCFTEGLLGSAPVETCRYCATGSAVATEFNVVAVETGGRAPTPTPRLGTATSSCGLCGSAAIESLRHRYEPLESPRTWSPQALLAVPDRVRIRQELFDLTGAVHAAGSFDHQGKVLLVREDIGRHNAVDKVVGRLVLDDALPATGCGLFVSGRASFEMVQKAWAAGFEVLVAVSAPSALAVEVAREANLLLAGFVRDRSLKLYTEAKP